MTRLKFESDDYYGPSLELEFDCTNARAVVVKLKGSTGSLEASNQFDIYDDQVDKVIAELTAWRERLRARLG